MQDCQQEKDQLHLRTNGFDLVEDDVSENCEFFSKEFWEIQ
jgi:hypothetical protein